MHILGNVFQSALAVHLVRFAYGLRTALQTALLPEPPSYVGEVQ
jgi:hypothetical protein